MVVKLSLHRNKVESRRKRDLSKTVQAQVTKMVRDNDIRAYAVVGISADGQAHALWDTGAILPLWSFGDTISSILKCDIEGSGLEDDWRPALTLKGGGQ